MKEIPLTKGKIAFVDDDDYAMVSQLKWRAQLDRGNWYAISGMGLNRVHFMHRFILGMSDKSIQVDHRDRNGLNNQKANLRPCTAQQNQANSKKPVTGVTSKYKGVSWHSKARKWYAHIMISHKRKHLGSFDSEIEAAKAYDAAAVARYGDFANANFKDTEPSA